jgi:hypothetical protein
MIQFRGSTIPWTTETANAYLDRRAIGDVHQANDKNYFFPLMSSVVARPIYAMSNGLSKIRDRHVRAYILYDTMIASLPTPRMYTRFGDEHFVIDTRDKGGMAQQIFAEGTYDFIDFTRVLEFLQ